MATNKVSQCTQTLAKSRNLPSRSTKTATNYLQDFPDPTLALMTFLQVEKKAARIRDRQCGSFLAHKIEGSGVLEEPEVRQAIYNLQKKATTDLSSVLRLLTLAR